MDAKKMEELKTHLKAALACLEMEPTEGESDQDMESAAPERDDDDMAGKSLKMKLGKYK